MDFKSVKDRRANSGNILKVFFIVGALLIALGTSLKARSNNTFPQKEIQENGSAEILKEIYEEVRELGYRENEAFIKREFHLDLDRHATNSEEHVLVLSYNVGEKEKLVVQVTYFETKENNLIKYAKDIKFISCYIDQDKIQMDKCDYDKKEIKSVLKQILEGIQEEKKLFKLIKHNNKP